MPARGHAVGYPYWLAATAGLPTMPAGKGSEHMPSGLGALQYDMMLAYLRTQRVYLYTGTTPASYTLGLIEAMMSGVPVVSIDAESWGDGWDGADLFEGDTIAGIAPRGVKAAREMLANILTQPDLAASLSRQSHERAVSMFGIEHVGAQWRAFLT
jgi:glycosyltransferase involved in cell wall biosynthesis